MSTLGLKFDEPVPDGGYRWWYVDAISDDGRKALSIIAFVGSVFSPYYAWCGYGNPTRHVAVNVALYSRAKNRWAMTERGPAAMTATPSSFQVGPSSLHWDGDGLTIDFDEVTAPIPERIKGTVRLTAPAYLADRHNLDQDGKHRWGPIAPVARIEVTTEKPAMKWSGHGYFDTNEGDEPLAKAFKRWDWSRAQLGTDTVVLYDMALRNRSRHSKGLRYTPDGKMSMFQPGPVKPLPRPLWGMKRFTQADADAKVRVAQTVEDGPFYVRSILKTRIQGEDAVAMHESVDLDKHSMGIVKLMLPWRMPQAKWWFGK